MSADRLGNLDDVDHAILDLLQRNARRKLRDVSEHVNLSISSVTRRIDRLEAMGVITGYRAVIDQRKLGRHLDAFTELTFAGDTQVNDISGIGIDLPEVQAVFTTAGDPDALVWISVKDVEDLARVIDLLRRSDSVRSTKTLMVLDTWRPSDSGSR